MKNSNFTQLSHLHYDKVIDLASNKMEASIFWTFCKELALFGDKKTNAIRMKYSSLANRVGYSERKCMEAVSNLKKKGYINIFKDGNQNVYQVNYEMIYNSEAKHRKEAENLAMTGTGDIAINTLSILDLKEQELDQIERAVNIKEASIKRYEGIISRLKKDVTSLRKILTPVEEDNLPY